MTIRYRQGGSDGEADQRIAPNTELEGKYPRPSLALQCLRSTRELVEMRPAASLADAGALFVEEVSVPEADVAVHAPRRIPELGEELIPLGCHSSLPDSNVGEGRGMWWSVRRSQRH